jgi:hypothetical protein
MQDTGFYMGMVIRAGNFVEYCSDCGGVFENSHDDFFQQNGICHKVAKSVE